MSFSTSALFQVAKGSFLGFARDRIFHACILFSLVLIIFALYLSTLTYIETRKLLLDFGLGAVSIAGLGISIFVGISAVAREIENRSIFTVLSKPVGRGVYIFGKFLGASAVLALVQGIMGGVLLVIVWANGEGIPANFLACLFLIFLENLLLIAAAILFSVLNSSSVLAVTMTMALLLIGRNALTLRLLADKPGSEAYRGLFHVLYNIVPNLERFNIRDLVAYGKPHPEGMIAMSTLYFFAYAGALLILTVMAFERKDLP